MRVSVVPSSKNHLNNVLFSEANVRDDIFAPYREIKHKVESHGGTIATFDLLPFETADIVLAFDFKVFPEAILDAINTVGSEKMVAIIMEPHGVAPFYYDIDIQKCFGKYFIPVLCPRESNCRYLEFPVSEVNVEWRSFESKKLLVSISSGKFLNFSGSLYEERIKAIKHFQKSIPGQFDMYGQGWKIDGVFFFLSPHRIFPSYRGPVISKHLTMRNYRFCLCYENTGTQEGYVSEKIFDPMQCGCVPIYLGAPDIHRHVPSECFIDLRNFSSYYELEHYISTMDSKDYTQYLNSIKSFLKTHDYKKRLPKQYAGKIFEILNIQNEQIGLLDIEKSKRKLILYTAVENIQTGSLKRKIHGFNTLFKLINFESLQIVFHDFNAYLMRKLRLTDFLNWLKISKI